jgi:hypothetical protein
VASGGLGARSKIGTFTTGAGLKVFDVLAVSVDRPSFALDPAFSLYSRLGTNAFAPPVLPCDSGSGPVVLLDGQRLCLPSEAPPPLPSCPVAEVAYDVTGLSGDLVAVRAEPVLPARLEDGAPAEQTVLEILGPAASGKVQIGCLTPGVEYRISVDLLGDASGILASQRFRAPAR